MERIYSAAIWYADLPTAKHNPINITKGVVVCGHRHGDIISTVYNLLGKTTNENGDNAAGSTSQGFLTNQNRFVDRVEALQIARAAGQILDEKEIRGNQLYSEDLY